MSQERIFADDWRDCLRSHYIAVIRQQDHRTEASLTDVMIEAGFDEDELAALRLDATLRAEDMPDDYVPDEVKAPVQGVDLPAETLPEVVAEEIEAVEPIYDELVEQVDNTDESLGESANEDSDSADDQDVQQLSLF